MLIAFREKECGTLTHKACIALQTTDEWVYPETGNNNYGDPCYFLKRQVLYLDNDEKENYATVAFYAWNTSKDNMHGLKAITIINEISPIQHGDIEVEN
ncbi:MAG: hypothetical protein ABW139_19455 [Candidatus Thiodiazotropha sp. DIVDIV]